MGKFIFSFWYILALCMTFSIASYDTFIPRVTPEKFTKLREDGRDILLVYLPANPIETLDEARKVKIDDVSPFIVQLLHDECLARYDQLLCGYVVAEDVDMSDIIVPAVHLLRFFDPPPYLADESGSSDEGTENEHEHDDEYIEQGERYVYSDPLSLFDDHQDNIREVLPKILAWMDAVMNSEVSPDYTVLEENSKVIQQEYGWEPMFVVDDDGDDGDENEMRFTDAAVQMKPPSAVSQLMYAHNKDSDLFILLIDSSSKSHATSTTIHTLFSLAADLAARDDEFVKITIVDVALEKAGVKGLPYELKNRLNLQKEEENLQSDPVLFLYPAGDRPLLMYYGDIYNAEQVGSWFDSQCTFPSVLKTLAMKMTESYTHSEL